MGKCTKRPISLSLLIFSTIFLFVLTIGEGRLPQAGADDTNSGTSYFYDVGSSPNKVWVSTEYNDKTKGWGKTRFAKIQDGVDAVAEGGTVNVGAGTYYERVKVEKSLDLIGEDKEKVIIDAREKRSAALFKEVTGGTVSGITFKRSRGGWDGGLSLRSCANLVVRDNIFTDNDNGIRMRESQNITIEENRIHANSCGIGYVHVFNNHIRNNDFEGNEGTVFGGDSFGNIFENNTMVPKTWGIFFLTNEKNSVVRNNYIDGYTYGACTPIRSIGCSYNLYKNNTIEGGGSPIWMSYDEGSIIAGNTITEEYGGDVISLYHVNKCNVVNNKITHIKQVDNPSVYSSITLAGESSHNTIKGNIMIGGHRGISLLYQSNNNLVTNNEVSEANYGIVVDNSSRNSIYKNNIIDNQTQGFSNKKKNKWSSKGKGNYWSDYDGVDVNGDGIGDTSYSIQPLGSDPSPLMNRLKIKDARVPRLKKVKYEPIEVEGATVFDRQVWTNETRDDIGGISIENGGSLTLRNVTLNFHSSVAGADGINVFSGGSLKIFNSKLYLSGGGINVHDGAKFELKNSKIYQGGAWLALAAVIIWTKDVQIKNNVFEDVICVALINGARNVTIADNEVKDCWHFIPGDANDLKVTGNRVENIIISGIEYIGHNITISKNKLKNIWGQGFVCGDWADVSNVTIEQNTFDSVRGPLFHIFAPSYNPPPVNQIYKNNFINYSSLGEAWGCNTFDKDFQGNYWSGYLDQNPNAKEHPLYPGVWDTPYKIPGIGDNQDNYPLMCPVSSESTFFPSARPILKSPASGSLVPSPLILEWYATGGDTEYRVQIATEPSFKTTIINKGQIRNTSFRVEGLNPSTKYFWRVIAATEGCYGNWSNVQSFLTGN